MASHMLVTHTQISTYDTHKRKRISITGRNSNAVIKYTTVYYKVHISHINTLFTTFSHSLNMYMPKRIVDEYSNN